MTYDPATQSFTLPAEHALVLADEDGPAFMASGFEVLASVWPTVDGLAHGYASGEGLGWHEHDSRLFVGFERFFRPSFRNLLAAEWLPAVPELVAAAEVGHPRPRRRLRAGHGDHRHGRGLPGLDVRGDRLPRGVGATGRHRGERTRAWPTASPSRSPRPRPTTAPTTSSACSTPCTTSVTRSARWPTPGRTSPRTGGSSPSSPTRATGWRTTCNPLGLIWYASGHNLCVPNAMSQGGAALGNQAGPKRTLQAFVDGGFPDARKVTESVFNMVIASRK